MSGPGSAPSAAVPTAASAPPFGSALSVNEFAALHRAGVAPLGLVMGCDLRSVYVDLPVPARPPAAIRSTGTGARRYDGDVVAVEELDGLVNDSRRAAIDHLRDEAAGLGANAVIGIRQRPAPAVRTVSARLAAHRCEGDHHRLTHRRALNHQFVGTAVQDPAFASDAPCLATLSATDFCKLRNSGWRPIGVVSGGSHQFGANVQSGFSASEITGATALWGCARAHAYEQTMAEMVALGAEGLLGLDVDDEHAIYKHVGASGSHWSEALLVTVSMIATAIRPASTPTVNQSPLRILTLR